MKLSKIRRKLNYNYQENDVQFYPTFGFGYENIKRPEKPVECSRCLLCSVINEIPNVFSDDMIVPEYDTDACV